MARTFIATDPRSGKHEVLIEVRPDLRDGAGPADLEQFEHRLYDYHISAGLLITPVTTHLLHDTYKPRKFSDDFFRVDAVPTAKLFSQLHEDVEPWEGLYFQVRRWLEAAIRSLRNAVPNDVLQLVIPTMIMIEQAELEEYGGVLDAA